MSVTPPAVDPQGRKITERQLQTGLRINIVAGAMGASFYAIALGMPLTMLMNALGASGTLIGLATTMHLYAMIAQVPGAFVCERLASRKPVWAAMTITHRALWFLPAALPLLLPDRPLIAAGCIVGAIALSQTLSHAATGAWFSWMADLVPEKIRGRFWGRRHAWCMAASLTVVALSGWVLDAFSTDAPGPYRFAGFALVFAVAATIGVIDIIVHLWVPEPRPEPAPARAPLLKRLLTPLRERNFRWTTFAYAAWMFFFGIVGPFGQVYLRRTFGISYTHLAWLGISGGLGAVVSAPLWGILMDRIGTRTFAALMFLIAPVFALAWFFVRQGTVSLALPLGTVVTLPQPVLLFLVNNLFAGMFYSGVGLSQLNNATAFAPRTGRTMAMAVYWTLVGCIGALGPLLGGHILDYLVNHPLPYRLPLGGPISYMQCLVLLHMAGAWLVALPMLMRIARQEKELPVGTVLSQVLIANPLRAVGMIYNLSVLGSPARPASRVRAVRELGARRTVLAVEDLVERLEDPAAEVREEATFALGAIGSSEALDALVEKLEDPHSDLAPQIARALRQSPDPRAVDPLVRKLADPDRETRSETARTLGEIGDRRAVPALLEVLSETKDAKVVSASSEALARLGELAAIYEMYPRMQASRNPVLRRSLAVAIGNLLGEPDGFYQILAQEEKTRGVAVDRLLRNLRAAVRTATVDHMRDAGGVLEKKIGLLEDAYEDEEPGRCTELMFHLGIGLAALRYGLEYGGDSEPYLEQLVWRDLRFGVGMWFLDLLRRQPPRVENESEPPDMIEVLLGIYFLAGWVPASA